MRNIAIEVILIVLLILANGLFALAELAVVSARKARLQRRAADGDRRAKLALELANAPGEFLSTVQIGITLIGVLAGAFGGVTIATHLAAGFAKVDRLAPYSEVLAVSLVVLAITYLAVIIGELVPKRLALQNPERLAAAVAPAMRVLAHVGKPVVRLLSASCDLVLRLLRVKPTAEPAVTEEEVRMLLEQATQAGTFQKAEREIVERVFRVADQRVSALMTPHTKILWLDVDDPEPELIRKLTTCKQARLPVAQGTLDNLLGMIRVREALARIARDEPLDLQTAMLPPLVVPEAMPVLKVLEKFKQARPHMALIVDEYGGVQGLITPHDILEAIVGDLPPVGVAPAPSAVQRSDGSWLLDGSMTIAEFKEMFRLRALPREGDYETLAGLILTLTGHVPTAGERCGWNKFIFEVMDMDGRRVDKVLVIPPRR